MKNLKSALKNVGWMILAMALVQALGLLIRPVTAGENINLTAGQSYQAISYGDVITDDGEVIGCDELCDENSDEDCKNECEE